MPVTNESTSAQEAAGSVETLFASLAEIGTGRAIDLIGETIETRYGMYQTLVKEADRFARPNHTEGLNASRERLAG